MTIAAADDPGDRFETESFDSVLVEFTDDGGPVTVTPPRAVVLRHLPGWLRQGLAAKGQPMPPPRYPVALADCLLQQGRLLAQLRRFAEAAGPVAEAERLYREAAAVEGLADCYHVSAEVHRGLGDVDRALDLLRREEEIRRRLAA